MPRYIDADKLISECEEEIVDYDEDLKQHFVTKAVPTEYIKDFPAADVQEVKHGEWLLERDQNGAPYCFHCSACDSEYMRIAIFSPTPFCPWCGAKMD